MDKTPSRKVELHSIYGKVLCSHALCTLPLLIEAQFMFGSILAVKDLTVLLDSTWHELKTHRDWKPMQVTNHNGSEREQCWPSVMSLTWRPWKNPLGREDQKNGPSVWWWDSSWQQYVSCTTTCADGFKLHCCIEICWSVPLHYCVCTVFD